MSRYSLTTKEYLPIVSFISNKSGYYCALWSLSEATLDAQGLGSLSGYIPAIMAIVFRVYLHRMLACQAGCVDSRWHH